MKPSDRQKMCPNCDGRVAYDLNQCPYCFFTLQVEGPSQGSLFKNPPFQDTLTPLYAPPYSPKKVDAENKKTTPKVVESQSIPDGIRKEDVQGSKGFWPIFLLSLAGNLFTLGVLQFFFSDQGKVKLELNSSYWGWLILLSFPLFYLGMKQVKDN